MPSDYPSSITMASTMKQTPLTCSGHTRPVVDLAFSNVTPAGYFLISACKDGKPMMRQGATGDWIGTFLGHKGAVWGVALNGDATRAATGSADFNAKLWDALSGEEVHNFTHQHIVKSVDFSKCGNRLLTGSNEKIMRIYDLEKPSADPIKISGHTSGIRHALFFGEKLLISAAEDKTVRVWDKDSLQEIKKLDFPAVPSCLEVTADGKIVLITHGHRVSFWNTETWEMEKEFVIPSQVNSASLHPSKQMFICGGEDFKMYKYDYESGTELESFKGHFGPIHCVRFSPDGELYASGSEDGTLRLWQTTVGKTYGLWKCVASGENTATDTSATNSSPQIIKSEA